MNIYRNIMSKTNLCNAKFHNYLINLDRFVILILFNQSEQESYQTLPFDKSGKSVNVCDRTE